MTNSKITTIPKPRRYRWVSLLAGGLMAMSFAAVSANVTQEQLLCPNGEVIATQDKGSKQQRAKTAGLQIVSTPQDFSDLPGWQAKLEPESLHQALRANCLTRRLPEGWGAICQRINSSEMSDIYAFIESHFTPYQLSVKNQDKGKFTSYYASYIRVSKQKNEVYRYPLYRVSERAKTLSRKQIEAGALGEQEVIFWADNAFDAYVLAVQGSGVGKLPNGEKIKILYSGKNNKNYVSLGKVLRECGEIAPQNISLPAIKEWVAKASEQAYQRLIDNNQSYVFFHPEPYNKESVKGALGVPLTAMRSLAVDTRYIPLGTMAYASVPHPLGQARIERVFLAQDKGGAINGGIRADIFAGEGDEAETFAGNMAHLGQFWLLKPKN